MGVYQGGVGVWVGGHEKRLARGQAGNRVKTPTGDHVKETGSLLVNLVP